MACQTDEMLKEKQRYIPVYRRKMVAALRLFFGGGEWKPGQRECGKNLKKEKIKNLPEI